MVLNIAQKEKEILDEIYQGFIQTIMFGSPTKIKKIEEESFPIAWIEVSGEEIAAAVGKVSNRAFVLDAPYVKTDREILTFTFKRWFRGMDF